MPLFLSRRGTQCTLTIEQATPDSGAAATNGGNEACEKVAKKKKSGTGRNKFNERKK